jgi:hypothetical protein
MNKLDLSQLSQQEKDDLLRKLSQEKTENERNHRDAYQAIRMDFTHRVKDAFYLYVTEGKQFKEWLKKESEAFFEVLREYGMLKREEQLCFTVQDGGFKFQVKGNRVKGFDERADIAEKRLVDFLTEWVKNSEKGTSDPMYKLAMKMIQRNESGDFDYKSISYLYDLERDFNDPEYSDIMQLFKESNTVECTVINFYFEEKDKYNNWKKIEPSFNRM